MEETISPEMEFLGSASDALCIAQARRRQVYDDNSMYKSKNLHAERRRRQKLGDRLLALRSLVPIITNMNKATIVEDAITYIQMLQRNVKVLSDQLLEIDSLSVEEDEKPTRDEINASEQMKKYGIKEDVKVTGIDGNKLWIRVVFEKKRGGITKFLEALTSLGFELTDANVTTSKGAILVSSCFKGIYGNALGVEQTKKLLQEIIRNM
ncbi:transcription factor DYT1-like [Pistacia vera]|uniref:transcription factor DYT1-like n=1 Tax=Pistacia vera TaxID=55513 RepID=UPI001262F459|nr:transcription factor DYT1-like [Pistacia vera]